LPGQGLLRATPGRYRGGKEAPKRRKEKKAALGAESLPEVAFYYPGHLWHSSEWIKSLLLFFDGIGLLVPEYKIGEPEIVDPVLAGPLRDEGLLHYLVADKVIDKKATQLLANTVGELIASGALNSLSQEGTAFHEISMSRMGYFGDHDLADELFKALKARGLAKESQDGVSIPLHPMIRYLILTLLAQILRSRGPQLGLDLYPATDQFPVVRGLTELLNLPALPSAGHVVAFDLQNVSVDLASVPLDEVLAFRAENSREHRKYMRSIRQFAREVSLLLDEDRAAAFRDRQEELDDLAADLRKKARHAWRRPASFFLGLAGGSWTFAGGNPLGALFSLGGLFTRGLDKPSNEAGAYSYLFSAHKQFA
jgi:hypothetical protein